jgi:hypothetical protein
VRGERRRASGRRKRSKLGGGRGGGGRGIVSWLRRGDGERIEEVLECVLVAWESDEEAEIGGLSEGGGAVSGGEEKPGVFFGELDGEMGGVELGESGVEGIDGSEGDGVAVLGEDAWGGESGLGELG